jgi:hypothetical protein
VFSAKRNRKKILIKRQYFIGRTNSERYWQIMTVVYMPKVMLIDIYIYIIFKSYAMFKSLRLQVLWYGEDAHFNSSSQ